MVDGECAGLEGTSSGMSQHSQSSAVFAIGCPTNCPPQGQAGARAYNGTIFRVARSSPALEDDVKSHRELGKECHGDECNCWGTSIWVSEDGVAHGLRAVKFFRKCHIFALDLTNIDGVVKHTRTSNQPKHHTWWRNVQHTYAGMMRLFKRPGNK